MRKEVVGRLEGAILKETELLGLEPHDPDKEADGPTYEHRPNVAIDIHAILLSPPLCVSFFVKMCICFGER